MTVGACARCSMCGIHYPAGKQVCEVTGCGERLSHFLYIPPDDDWAERVRDMNRTFEEGEREDPDGLRAYRLLQYEQLGFPDYAAHTLADAEDSGCPLWWGRVANALSRGASHSEALRIFA